MADGTLLITDQTVRYAREGSEAVKMTVEETMRTALHSVTDAGKAIAELNGKIFEFGQQNFNAAMDFGKQLANAGTLKDVLRIQTAYMQGQTLAMTNQMETLRDLSLKVFQAAFNPFKTQALLSAQSFRSC
jgi:hypothetical protein